MGSRSLKGLRLVCCASRSPFFLALKKPLRKNTDLWEDGKKMKKKLIYGLAFIGMSTLLTGCHMKHGWTEETCTEPRTCSVGGETEGEALGHTWLEATCTEPKICSVCGETEGEALGHTWTEAANDASIACAICNFSAEELLNKPFGDEEITSIDMTLNSDMTLNMSDDDSGAAMEVNFTSDIDTQVCPTATHLVGSFSLNMLGRDVTQGIESYEIVNPDGSSLVYDKDYDTSTWIYFDSEAMSVPFLQLSNSIYIIVRDTNHIVMIFNCISVFFYHITCQLA